MATTEHIRFAANFGIFMLCAGGLGLLTGTTLSRQGFVTRAENATLYWTCCGCHLFIGAFCYFGQFFVQSR